MDSIKTGRLLSLLKKSLGTIQGVPDLTWLDAKAIFQQPTILVLANYIYSHMGKNSISADIPPSSRESKMEELVKRFTSGLTPLARLSKRSTEANCVTLIGSTGFLGPQIVKFLLLDSRISSVYCLNRGEDAKDRTLSTLGQTLPNHDMGKLQFLRADLGKPFFGLDGLAWESISSNSTHLIFNAWNPNFSLPIQSFTPFLQGLRTSIDMSASRNQPPHIVFVSSIAAIGSWPHVHDGAQCIPETPASANMQAMCNGYGESKCIGEQILTAGNKFHGIPVSIVRAGQIGGFEDPTVGAWPRQGWLYNLFKASHHLGSFPESVAPFDWIPVDTFAKGIANLCRDDDKVGGVKVYNMVHPKPAPWRMIYSILTAKYGLKAGVESLPSWLDRLEETTRGVTEPKAGVGISKIYDFLRSLKHGREFDMACDNANAAMILGEVVPLDEDLLEQWFKPWVLNFPGAKGKI